jgi:hypothetical protein
MSTGQIKGDPFISAKWDVTIFTRDEEPPVRNYASVTVAAMRITVVF